MNLRKEDCSRLSFSTFGLLYTITCMLEIYCFIAWISIEWIIFFSLFTFGLPLLFTILPAIGFYMFKAKRWWSILLNYFFSLSVVPSLLVSLENFPLKRMVDEAPHYETLSREMSYFIIVTFISFLVVATMSAVYCLMTYKHRRQLE